MTRQNTAGTGTARDGALAGYLVGFREELARCGYGPARTGAHLELFADLCRWTEREGIALPELGDGQVAVFLEDRRRRGHGDLVSPAGVRPLVGYLTRGGAITGQGFAVPEGAARPRLEGYVEVGCRLAAALERGGAVDWQRVRARDVTRFLLGNCPPPRGHHAPGIISPL